MRDLEGDRPGGAAPAPKPLPNSGPPRFASLSPAEQIRVIEILRPGWERALARRAERKRLEAETHVRAA